MADDPRMQLIDRVLGDGFFPGEKRELLTELDRVDPLRDLLADEDRAVNLLCGPIFDSLPLRHRAGGHSRDAARAVLAALREVAGP